MANIFININNNLGENILYNEIDNSLYWIDINEMRLNIYNLESLHHTIYNFKNKPCSYCFTTIKDILLIAFDNGFYYFNRCNEHLVKIESAYKQLEASRLNDGKADPYGNFICGGFSEIYLQELWLVSNKSVYNIINSPKHTIWNATCFSTDKLYRIVPKLAELTLNTMEPALDAKSKAPRGGLTFGTPRYMYCTDSPKKELWRYNYDIDNRSISNKTIIYSLYNTDLVFDGACVDREDYIWVAIYNGSCVYRISPDGNLDKVINIPNDKYITSVCIGGLEMDTLFIVSGHFGERNNKDINGFIYSYKLDKPLGVIENRFCL
jgi:L-arabinonolactonase